MRESIDRPVIAIVGPTAIGKTDLSVELAGRLDGEVISLDSMQVYRYMDIGTAKANVDERAGIPHHLIDICNPDEQYDAAQFARDALRHIREIHRRGRIPLLVGGAGLYLKALTDGIFAGPPVDQELRAVLRNRLAEEGRKALHAELCKIDPEAGERIHQKDTQRLLRGLEIFHSSGITWTAHLKRQRQQQSEQGTAFCQLLQIGLTCERSQLYERINLRSRRMLEHGFEQEVRDLRRRGWSAELKSMQSIGYRQMNEYLDGRYDDVELLRRLAQATRHYAKRQYTWFRQLKGLQWFPVDRRAEIIATTTAWRTRCRA